MYTNKIYLKVARWYINYTMSNTNNSATGQAVQLIHHKTTHHLLL